ncbi:MAG TPA: glycosyltransferase family 1 protein [Paludibacter sp.]
MNFFYPMKTPMHVICFDVPFPTNYGGVIDLYFKLKALKNEGVYIILHVFIYGNRSKETDNLGAVADEIYYYPRKTGLFSNLSFKPYIVYSRRNKKLLNDLLKDDYPILFEGLHSCYLLPHKALRNRTKWVRCHNIEHEYYHYLTESTTSFWKKMYYFVEGQRLKFYQKNLVNASVIFAISKSDKRYFEMQFPKQKVELLSCFSSAADAIDLLPEKSSDYFLYHGNLAVEENQKVVLYLLEQVLPLTHSLFKLKIAGNQPPKELIQRILWNNRMELIENPTDVELNQLIAHAKANVLITFQPTGIKLKLLNALYNGGFCIVNETMLIGTDLENLCLVADTPKAIASAISLVSEKEFSIEDRRLRLEKLSEQYSNKENVKVILRQWGR